MMFAHLHSVQEIYLRMFEKVRHRERLALHAYVDLLSWTVESGRRQEAALRIGIAIRELLTDARGGGVGMQDIVKYHKQGYQRHWIDSLRAEISSIDSLRAEISSIQSVLSSELSTIIEEIFTVLEENITFFEGLSTIFVDDIDMQGPTEHHSVAYAVVVSAVVLLCFVYQYLIGYVDRGGSKADSSGSLEFRDTYISIVLFLGSYIWIKSRDVAPTSIPKTAIIEHATHRKYGVTVKFIPRFKPRKENGVNFERIYLREFPTRIEAEVVFRTAASCYEYEKHYGPQVDLGDGRFFTIPPLSEDEQGLSGMEKVEMVKARAKRVHEAFVEVWNSPPTLPGAEMSQQRLLQGIQVGEGNALLQVPGNQTQDSRMMQDISMQVFQAQHVMQTSQLPCQDISHVPQQTVEEVQRQILQLKQDVQRLELQVQQMDQRHEQVVQRQELQLQQQTKKLKIYRALMKRRGSTCKKSGTQGSARKFSGLPQFLVDLVPGPSSVPNLQLQDQNPESTHLQQRNEEPMPPSFRADGVLESTDLEPHPEEAHSHRQMVLNQEFPRPEQDQNPESTHLQQRNEEPVPPSFRPDEVLESTDLEPHPEEAHSHRQMMFNPEFPRPEQDQNPESTHLQQRNEEPMSPILRPDGVTEIADLELAHFPVNEPWWLETMEEMARLEQGAPCVNGGDGGMCDEEPRMDGDGSDNVG